MKNFIGSKSRLLLGVTVLIAILSISNSCNKSSYNSMTGISGGTGGTGGTGGPGVNEVFIQSFAFSPSTITVAAGTTITWTNKDAVAHTVTSNSGLFDSGSMGKDATYSHTFATAGTFAYYCKIHTNMTASVVVN
jgi:plastocyanin